MNVKHVKRWYFLIALLLFSQVISARSWYDTRPIPTIAFANLPAQAQQMLATIQRGPPYPYKKDGVVFGNYQGLLPKQRRGYYHEFTVKTLGRRDRGPQRLIVGGHPASSNEIYYTADHYASFYQIRQ